MRVIPSCTSKAIFLPTSSVPPNIVFAPTLIVALPPLTVMELKSAFEVRFISLITTLPPARASACP